MLALLDSMITNVAVSGALIMLFPESPRVSTPLPWFKDYS